MHAAAVNIIKAKNKLSNNRHITIVIVILQYCLVEIEGKIAIVIFFYTNVQGRNKPLRRTEK